MKYLVVSLLVMSMSAHAATAYWTGNVRYVQTVTYQAGVSCEYQYAGRKFWATFTGTMCPMNIEVQ